MEEVREVSENLLNLRFDMTNECEFNLVNFRWGSRNDNESLNNLSIQYWRVSNFWSNLLTYYPKHQIESHLSSDWDT